VVVFGFAAGATLDVWACPASCAKAGAAMATQIAAASGNLTSLMYRVPAVFLNLLVCISPSPRKSTTIHRIQAITPMSGTPG
jgi:hypothetical protein